MSEITTRHPDLSSKRMSGIAEAIFDHVGLDDEADRDYVLSEVSRIKSNKDGPVWAPWDIVLQPGISILLVLVGVLGFLLLAGVL
jgi:hypothetical protein